MKNYGIYLMLLVLSFASALHAKNIPSLRFSGVLGQSQPINQKPIDYMGAAGVVFDAQGNMWVSRGRKIYQFKKIGDQWLTADSLDLPDQSRPCGLFWDGECLVQLCNDNRIYSVNPVTKITEILATIPDKDVRGVLVIPKNLQKGFALKGKLFVLQGNHVLGVNGDTLSVVLTLPPTPEGERSWHYCALGIEPNSGDLLVGSYYPDCKVYRYDATGAEVRKEQWPRPGFVNQIVSLKNQAWGIAGPRLIPLSDKTPEDLSKGTLGPYPLIAFSGLAAAPDGNFWIACSQGLLEINPQDPTVFARLGGLDGVDQLVVGNRGAMIGTVEGGFRIIELCIDDEPNTPLLSSANEPFRIGGNWKSKARGMVCAGDKYIILDDVAKQLWSYRPDLVLQPEAQAWGPLTEPGVFTDPKAITLLGESLLVMDGNQLKERSLFNPSTFHDVALPNPLERVDWMAGNPNGLLVIANPQEIRVYRRMEDGSCQLKVALHNLSISGIAVSGESIFVSDNPSASVVVYDSATGERLGAVDAKDQGGIIPGSLAVSAPWLFVADGKGKRILRFRILR